MVYTEEACDNTMLYNEEEGWMVGCMHHCPSKGRFKKLGYMEGYLTNGTIYVYSEKIDDDLPKKLNAMDHQGNVVFAAGKIDDSLMIIRFLGDNMIELKEMIDAVWGQLRRELLNKEPVRIRKY